ncbi:EamA family transporter [Amycolatopsis endophytica]|uniref:Drug/metabolite transporter (DMT)-like permease n=1 Tax=Amycolatopsis endophytica TaxID=860233 RepID=A0A853AVP9_9PSEU|nr:EamA family transporter [Amycolatopsis endophytica]NYI86704.1 drug/metabolite transporter (DMT)-like permease [Amycolatopsis endophytica]
MDGTALAFVLVAAVVHAGWNLAAKRVDAGARFVFLYYTVSAVVCAPLAVAALIVSGERPHWTWLVAALLTAVFHVAYGIVLQRGYRVGDLSVVYPLARGSGPLLSVLAAVVLLGERPGWLGLAGALLVVAGVLVIGLGPSADRRARRAGVFYGLLTGVTIAGYTLWDDHSVNALAVPPLIYFATGAVLQSLLLAPAALRSGGQVATLWRAHWRETLVVGMLSPVAYLLVLYAMRRAPVSLVAPAREVSIVLGGIAAWIVLGEANPVRRLVGSTVVLAGIAAIAAS